MGISSLFHGHDHSPAEGIVSIWGSSTPFWNDFIHEPYCHGWHLNRSQFDTMLMNSVRAAGSKIFCDGRVIECHRNDRRTWSCSYTYLNRTHSCSAQFVVDATGKGGGSAVAHLSPRLVQDSLIAVSWRAISASDDPYALIESVDDGWLYSVVLPDRSASIIYSTDADIYRARKCKTPDYVDQLLKKAPYTKARVARIDYSNSNIYSAATVFRRTVVGDHWLAVGDAAASVDSLSGQGLCRALETAQNGAQTIYDHINGVDSLGEYSDRIRNYMEWDFLASRYYYSQERRWPRALFWSRRLTVNTPQYFPGARSLAYG
jgi:flavin-dependent dehydrogenase